MKVVRKGSKIKRRNDMTMFWSRVQKTDSCWNWIGLLFNNGYGQYWMNGKTHRAHKLSYEECYGEINYGLQIDHLCRNKICVRPDHLEAVSPYVNNMRSNSLAALNARKTHCKRGHEFTKENTFIKKIGSRICIKCQKDNGHWVNGWKK